jgi:hypothetical protein
VVCGHGVAIVAAMLGHHGPLTPRSPSRRVTATSWTIMLAVDVALVLALIAKALIR